MAELRRDIKDYCDVKCVMHLRGLHYFATVKNISLGGALVHFNFSTHSLHVGDTCNVSMNGGPIREYPCELVRVKHHIIALKFTDMNK